MFISQTGPNIAPGDVSAYLGHRGDGMPYVVVNLGRDAALHVHTPEQADALIAAAVEAKRLLDPPATECPKCGTEWADEHGEDCEPVITENWPPAVVTDGQLAAAIISVSDRVPIENLAPYALAKRLIAAMDGTAPVIADSEPAPKPAAALEHMCECGHFEAYHVGAVKGDEHPGQCTSCDTCDTYAAAS